MNHAKTIKQQPKKQVTSKVDPGVVEKAEKRMWANAQTLGPQGVDNISALVAFCLKQFGDGKVPTE